MATVWRRRNAETREDADWASLPADERQEQLLAELVGEAVRIRQIVVAWWWLFWLGVVIVGLSVIFG